jgi:hypothetical protein
MATPFRLGRGHPVKRTGAFFAGHRKGLPAPAGGFAVAGNPAIQLGQMGPLATIANAKTDSGERRAWTI